MPSSRRRRTGSRPIGARSRWRSDDVRGDAVETSWLDAEVLGVPSDPLPSDPDWAGKTVFVDARTAFTHRRRRRSSGA